MKWWMRVAACTTVLAVAGVAGGNDGARGDAGRATAGPVRTALAARGGAPAPKVARPRRKPAASGPAALAFLMLLSAAPSER